MLTSIILLIYHRGAYHSSNLPISPLVSSHHLQLSRSFNCKRTSNIYMWLICRHTPFNYLQLKRNFDKKTFAEQYFGKSYLLTEGDAIVYEASIVNKPDSIPRPATLKPTLLTAFLCNTQSRIISCCWELKLSLKHYWRILQKQSLTGYTRIHWWQICLSAYSPLCRANSWPGYEATNHSKLRNILDEGIKT